MARHYTVIFIDDQGSAVREARVSNGLIHCLAVLAVLFAAVIGTGTHRYFTLRGELADKGQLLSILEEKHFQIEDQKKQIHTFAETVNELKSKLMALNQFEQKIRIMANIEHKTDQASLFAIGGAMPDDLDTNVPPPENGKLIREMHSHIGQLEQVSAIQQDNFEFLIKSLGEKKNVLAATPSLRPAQGWVSSDFGYRIWPFTGRRELHKGLDIAAREGTPIIAPANGVVTFAGPKWLIGNLITLDHGYGITTRYGHTKEILKKKGERVKRGEVIATVGNTGRSTGPHLHYEVRLNGLPVDPNQYIFD
jgi:murein DD-endopeptidase MepM/ murein hydrolase activator NlpD